MSLDALARACIAFAREAAKSADPIHDPWNDAFHDTERAVNAAENALAAGNALDAIANARHSVSLSRGECSAAYRLCTEAMLNAKATVEAQQQLAALRTLPERKARYQARINAARAAR
jgi:hypothetical protein